MNDRDALFEAILAEPDDDLPRLVFADWVEEHGETDRAEFIRVQIELAKLDEYDARREPLRVRESALLTLHEEPWSRPFLELMRQRILPENGRAWESHPWEYRRGFVECVEFWSVEGFLNTAADLFRLTPMRHLYVHGNTGWAELAASPHLARLHTLEVDQGTFVDVGSARRLAHSHCISGLTSLILRGVDLGDHGVRMLARSPHLANLETLCLSEDYFGGGQNGITSDGIQALTTSAYRNTLTSLDLGGTYLGIACNALAHAWNLSTLTDLGLRNCGISDGGLQELVRSKHLTRLESLDLSANRLGDRGAATLVEWPGAKKLKVLDLGDCGIGDAGARALADSPHLQQLVYLALGGNELSVGSCQMLKDRFGDRVHL